MNWGKGIAIFLTVFVISILTLVYKASQTSAELVAEDYYAQELEYQDVIEARARGRHVEHSLSILVVGEEVLIQADTLHFAAPLPGKLRFYRPSDSSLDREYVMQVGGAVLKLPLSDFRTGVYNVELRWQEGDKDCMAVLENISMP